MLEEFSYTVFIEGGKRLRAEGVGRIMEYSPESVVLRIGKKLVEVVGENLSVIKVDGDIVEIGGRISGVADK